MKVESAPEGIRLGGWNYRVVRRTWPSGEITLAIHEAHYEGPKDDTVDDPVEAVAVLEERAAKGERMPLDHKPHAITEDAMDVMGENLTELRETLQRMLRALDKPVLDYETRDEVELTPEQRA